MQKSITESQQGQISAAVEALKRSGVIAFPTETVYGLGCDPRDQRAVDRIFELKGRDLSKPLLLVAASMEQVSSVAVLEGKARMLAETYWPGPLTLILPLKQGVALATGVPLNGEVTIRWSASPVVCALTEQFGFPVVATSANRSGETETHSVAEVEIVFPHGLDGLIDGGVLTIQKTSTIIRVHQDGSYDLIREGTIQLPEVL